MASCDASNYPTQTRLGRWSTLRLWAMSLVLLIGAEVHSEPAQTGFWHSFRIWFTSLFGLFIGFLHKSPASALPADPIQVEIPKLAPMIRQQPMTKAEIPDPNSIVLHRNTTHPYVYIFEGKALYHGQPCPDATVSVRVKFEDGSLTRQGRSRADGSFSIPVAVVTTDNSVIEWAMEAQSETFQPLETVGRRILTHRDEDTVVVPAAVNFIALLPK
jgi:hypothetical protein